MMRSKDVRRAALTLANVLLPVAVLVFASGFFPYKPVLPGLASSLQSGEERGRPVFDRVVFMVVDALRSDFVYGYHSGFDFTQSLIRSGAAIPFTAHASPPTVTMPRVKALTTGSVPSFLDLILNFAESDTSSSLAAQDTWLAQIKARGGKIVFYGDDTWLKLFPPACADADAGSKCTSFFEREDGTSSFFVSDFTEVDNNVTRHVPGELAQSDWNAMVMHYLGMDHIGHKTGPQGPNMLPKQREMDGIVRTIYDAIQTEDHLRDTLLVLAGDHGMNAGGNHGGSGPGETEPALLFASPKFQNIEESRRKVYECPTAPKEGTEFHYYTKVEQSDLIPTLAGLMGLPISRNSLGISIPELDGLLTEVESLEHLRMNVEQIIQIVTATYGLESWTGTIAKQNQWMGTTNEKCEDLPEGEQRLACYHVFMDAKLHEQRSPQQAREARTAIMSFLLSAQESLSGTASSYNIPRMISGMALTAIILGVTLSSFQSLGAVSVPGLYFAFIGILYGVMMFASSYVEEEQHFWYWLAPAWIVTISTLKLPNAVSMSSRARLVGATFTLLAVHRLCVRWNQTGQKHAGAPDIVHTFFTEHHVFMWILVLTTYGYNCWQLVTAAFGGLIAPEPAAAFSVALVLPAVVFKLVFTQADAPELVQNLAFTLRKLVAGFDLVLQARVAFIGMALATVLISALAVMSYRQSKSAGMKEIGLLPSLAERIHVLLTLFLMTQTRAPNVPLFLGLELQREALAYILTLAPPRFASPSTTNARLTSYSTPDTAAAERMTQIATTVLLLSHTTFFCFGGSNSISSIDLSNAYNGVADYNIVAVGILLFASNWAGPVWWVSTANLLLNAKSRSLFSAPAPLRALPAGGRAWIDDERRKLHDDTLQAMMGPVKSGDASEEESVSDASWADYVGCMTAFEATALLAVMAACTALRTHLFIWTVFSPKYLYAMAWSVGWHLLVNVGLGSLLSWLVRIA